MAQALSPTAAKISYVVHRGVRPAVNVIVLLAAGYSFYVHTRPKQDCSLRPASVVQVMPDGTVILVDEKDHPSLKAVAERKAREIGETFASFKRGDTGPLRARLDRVYEQTHPDYRPAFLSHAERLVERASKVSVRRVEDRLAVSYLPEKKVWRAVYQAKVVEEDENGRQVLKRLIVGMHFRATQPSAASPAVLYLSELGVDVKDDLLASKGDSTP